KNTEVRNSDKPPGDSGTRSLYSVMSSSFCSLSSTSQTWIANARCEWYCKRNEYTSPSLAGNGITMPSSELRTETTIAPSRSSKVTSPRLDQEEAGGNSTFSPGSPPVARTSASPKVCTTKNWPAARSSGRQTE